MSDVSPSSVEERLFDAAREGDAAAMKALLDLHPEQLGVRQAPYEWSLLHIAAHEGRLPVVELLLERGLPANALEQGDRTTPMHWAAAAGHVAIVRRLIEAGGDVIGAGDDHALEVIGWATCWDGSDDSAHRQVVDLLVQAGARHHIFSAIAMHDAELVRRVVREDPAALGRRLSRNEDHQVPLQFAVRKNRPEMVALLMELGADPLAVDGSGFPVAAYATSPDVDRPVVEAIRSLTMTERSSAERGYRPPHVGPRDLVAALALGDFATAEWLLAQDPALIAPDGPSGGALHLMAKRGDEAAARWLLAHGADPNGRWRHWGAEVTPPHLAILGGHTGLARLLFEAGADPSIRDSEHDADATEWARFFRRDEILKVLEGAR